MDPIPTPTILAYKQQLTRRLIWLLISITIGTAAGVAVEIFGTDYPGWKVGVFVAGALFFPWFITQAFGKNVVSTREALNSARSVENETANERVIPKSAGQAEQAGQ